MVDGTAWRVGGEAADLQVPTPVDGQAFKTLETLQTRAGGKWWVAAQRRV